MLAAWNEAERFVERGHTIDIDERMVGLVRNDTQHIFGEVAVLCLDFLQDGNETAAMGFVLLDDRHDDIWLHTHSSSGEPSSLSRDNGWMGGESVNGFVKEHGGKSQKGTPPM